MAKGRPEGEPKVFISHAGADEAEARRIDRALKDHGARTFLVDPGDEESGDEGVLPERILQELGWCDVLLLLWSRHASEAGRPAEEAAMAGEFGKSVRVHPLDETPIPESLRAEGARGDDEGGATALVDRVLRDPGGGNRAPRVEGIKIGPGRWTIESPGPIRPMEMTLELLDGGGLRGTSRTPTASGQVVGTWDFREEESLLILDVEVRVGLQPLRERMRMTLIGSRDSVIEAEDASRLGPDRRSYRIASADRGP